MVILLDFFNISRGVRQGCPLSPYIFILCAKVFAIKNRNCTLIKGISILDNNLKLCQYADDTVLFLDNSPDSYYAAMDIIDKFRHASGLKVNLDILSLSNWSIYQGTA